MEQVKLTRRSFVAGATAAGALAALSLTGCGGGSSEKKDDGAKSDGTAKGGIVIAIARELGVPVKFAGVGEGIDDLRHAVAEFKHVWAEENKSLPREPEDWEREAAEILDGNDNLSDPKN